MADKPASKSTSWPQAFHCPKCGGALDARVVEFREKQGEPPWQWTIMGFRWEPVPHECEPRFPGHEIHGDLLISTAPVTARLSDG